MRFFKLSVVFLAFSFCACTTEDPVTENNSDTNSELINPKVINSALVTDPQVLEQIAKLDLDVGLVTIGDFHLPDGSVEKRYFIGDDISITKRELSDMIDLYNNSAKQFRTFNLVTPPNQTINILGYTVAPLALTAKGQTALTNAVQNFNNLNTALQFNLTFGADFEAADMVVFDNSANNPSSGGVAGFPSVSGQANKFIQIYGLDSFSADVNEHVITHEMGHSIGFRHTDWFDRGSCGGGIVYEGATPFGSVHIPGTPTGRDLTSIMQACFNLSVNGEFNANDVTALEFMYPIGGTTSPCDGVPAWDPAQTYAAGDRVTYFGNLFEYTSSGLWLFISAC